MEKENSNHTIDFRVLAGGDVVTTFNQLRNFQNLGMASKMSNITFNDVTLPAGVFEDVNQYVEVYSAVSANDVQGAINAIPETMDPSDYRSLLQAISRESQKKGGNPIDSQQLETLVAERYETFAQNQMSGKTV